MSQNPLHMFSSGRCLQEMASRTMWLILDTSLFYEPLDVYDNMHHEIQPCKLLFLWFRVRDDTI